MHAVRLARMLEPFDPFWYEEPVSPATWPRWRVPARHPDAIVTGEELYTRFEFREVFERRARTSSTPTSATSGHRGAAGDRGDGRGIPRVVSPHNYNSTTVGLAATLQVSAAIPNFLITEYFRQLRPRAGKSRDAFKVEQGYYAATGPGLGVELREDVLARYAYREFPARRCRRRATRAVAGC